MSDPKSKTRPWQHAVDRRTVLKGMAVGGGALLVGQASAINGILPAYGTEQLLSTADSEGLLQVVVKNGIILRVESLDYPNNEASPMGLAWAHRQYAPDRILYPMVRADWAPGGGGDRTTRGKPNYKRVSWSQALDLVANELKRVKSTYGNEALHASSGWQTAGNFNTKGGQIGRFYGLFGGYTNRIGNKSYACWQWAAPYSWGTIFPQDSMADTLQNSKGFIFWASNPMNVYKVRASSYKRMRDWIWKLKQNGIRIVTIDPLFTETAALSDEWLPIRPGSDGALMAAMAYVMVSGNHHDQAFIDKYAIGFEPFRKYIMGESDGQPKTPEWAATKTDLSAAKIRELATFYATTKGVKIGSARGIQRQDHGEQNVRMLIALATIKGEFGLPGGGMSFDIPGSAGNGDAKVKGKGPAGFPGAENPVTQVIIQQKFADSILNAPVTYNHDGTAYPYPEPGKSEIKLIHTVGDTSTVLNQHDQINLNLKALQKIETIITQDSWWTPAARMADIVLPINTLFERNDMTRFWRYVVYQHQIVEPLGEARSDFEVFRDLADRLGFKDKFTLGRDTEDAWLRFLYSSADLGMTYDQFKQQGYVKLPVDDTPYVAFSEFRANPALNPLGTPSGKFEIHSAKIDSYHYDDCPGTPQWMEPVEWLGSPKTGTYPLHLLTPHPLWRRHSSYDDVDSLRKNSKINGFEPLTINSEDAKARGIVSGDLVRVFNDRGQAVCAADVTDDVRPRVVILHEGSWYRPAEPGTIGSIDRGGCANMFTRQTGTSQLAQGPVVGSNLVQIEKYQGSIQPNDYAPIKAS